MNHLKKLLFCYILFMFTVAIAFTQEAKNALLIANSDYPDEIGDLPKPIPEAEALKAALESIGFEVTMVTNADKETMVETLQHFKEKTEKVGGIAFFHYGGHAVQVNGINYLLPALTKIENESKVRFRCVELDEVMQSMRGKSNIVILDSCRNNPFGNSRGAVTRGLAVVSASKNSIISYAADAGQEAKDGIFTPLLTNLITQKDKTIDDVLKEVRKEVLEKTNGEQSPAAYTKLTEDIFLAGRSSSVETLTGSLLITSECAVTVYLDGEKKEFIKEDGSVLIKRLRTGSYTVEVKSDINKFERKVKISADTQTAVNIKTGYIKLTSEVSGKVYLNGKYYQDIGSYGNIIFPRLLEGNYDIEVRTESQTFKQEARVHVGETTSVSMEKPKEATAKIQAKTEKASAYKEFYAPGFSIGYSFSHFTVSNIASFNAPQGLDLKLDPARFALGSFDLKIFCLGYAYSHAVITSKNNKKREQLDYHEFNFVPLKFGGNLNWFFFHLGVGPALLWEKESYLKLKLKNPANIFQIGLIIPIDIGIKFADFMGVYAEYKPTLVPIKSSNPFVKHSFNVGFSFHIPCYF